MVLRVHNADASTQSRYVPFTIPLGYVNAQSLTDHIELGSGAIASRQWDDGQDAIYCVTDDWASGTNTHTLAAAGTPPDPIFSLHSAYGTSACGAITSLLPGSIPRVYATMNGVDVLLNPTMRDTAPTYRINGTLMKQAVWEEHFDGWHVYHAVTFYSDQALADVYTSVVWSDETYSSAWYRQCSQLKWVYGHEVLPKFLANEGFTRSNGNRTITLSTTFVDGHGAGTQGRASWAGNMYHGRHLAVRGWMFGRGSSTIPGDEAIFDACDHLDANCSATEWEGYWQYSGAVGTVPTNTDVVRPDYADTTRHYVSWDRGTGGSDATGAVGLVFSSYANAQSLQGALGLCAGGAVIHGYQRLYDYECATADWAIRPHWIKKDGSRPLPSVNRGERFCLLSQEPHFGFTDITWGRDPNNTHPEIPKVEGEGNQDGFDGQHRTSTTLTAYYQLAKYDYFAYILMLDWIHTEALNSRRGGAFVLGSSMSGNREVTRSVYAVANAAAACPELWPMAREILISPIGSYMTSCLEAQETQRRPPGGSVATHSWWMSPADIDGGNHPYTTTTGVVCNASIDAIFEAMGAQGIFVLWKVSGDSRMYDMFIRFSTSIFRDGTFWLRAGDPSGSPDAALVTGWTLPYEPRVNWSWTNATDRGLRTSDAQRTYGSADFNSSLLSVRDGLVYSLGGPALRNWAVGAAELVSRVHPDPTVRARARNVYLTAAQGTGTPLGWLHSYFIASAQLTN